ncbi:arylesterase [Geobacter chapellei]|uniref:Arylesterase n=2 Tax=Pelotalea chapellei TaxID=44671 RepID=A0ABS5U9D8_9BACT|nr:GDSL-type esterase/lipase family protein [Pelotalea chapellei]MBT1072303.1 arylesterase [Pelotalea chapellei]
MLYVGCSKVPQLSPLPERAVIVAFGDSLTAGTGAGEAESYPAVLSRLVARTVVNSGIPGEFSADGTARLANVLDQEHPSLLILCHGGNDMLARHDNQKIAHNLRSMVRLAHERGIAVVLLAVPAPDPALRPPALYEEVAKEFGLPVEQKAVRRILGTASLKSDYIHPNAAGYAQLAEAVAELLRSSGALER